jgi:glycerol-3-phosphate acyltransferase PlsY
MNSFMVTKSKQTFLTVFIVDFLKGVIAVFAAQYVGGESDLVNSIAILGVVLGHNFNIWLSISSGKLEGGKGLAAGLGALAMSLVKLIPVWIIGFALGFFLYKLAWGKGKIAPGTTLATLILPVAAFYFYGPVAAVIMGITTLAIVIKHVTEMRELLAAERPGTQS